MATVGEKWHEGPMVAFDLETSGLDVLQDRIITAAVVFHTPGERPRRRTWVIDPDVDIPVEASDVHGWTADRIRAELDGFAAASYSDGRRTYRHTDPASAINEIAGCVALAMSTGTPLVAFNAAFDLSLLEAECRRHSEHTLAERLAPKGIAGVVDPMVIEKQYDPYRKSCYKAPGCRPEDRHHECGGCRGGKTACGGCGSTDRTLTSLCAHYRVWLADAHTADADAWAAVLLTRRLVRNWPEIGRWRLHTLHDKQVGWKAEQQSGLASFFRKIGEIEKADSCCGSWPVHGDCCAPAEHGALL